MSEELRVLKIVTGCLNGARIPYMITGSIAMNYYAVPRMTRDIDIVVELTPEDVDTIHELFSTDFYVDREIIREAIAQRGIFNIIHHPSVIKVDFIVRKDTDYRQEEFRRRRRVPVEDVEVAFVSPEDLILSKLVWARESRSEIQLADVRNLLANVEDLDRKYLKEWAGRLGLEETLREMTR